jgi:phytoene dehydrogenase-like protein
MMLHLAMDALPDWAAGAELKDFAYVHLAPSFRQMAQTYTDAMAGLLPAEPVLVVGQPTTIDPTRAPEGKHTLWVQVRMVPAEIAGDAKGEIDARDWETVKDAMAERVLDIIESYAPGTCGPRSSGAPWSRRSIWRPTTPTSSAATRWRAATI